MKRNHSNPNKHLSVINPLQVYEGGTKAVTVAKAQINLDILPASTIRTPNGAATLPSQGLAGSDFGDENGALLNAVNVEGPVSIAPNVATTYKVTDYDISTAYTVSAVNGTVSFNAGTITFTAGTDQSTAQLIVNGRTIDIGVEGLKPKKPAITSPTNSAIIGGSEVAVIASAFVGDGTETHLHSDWEIAADATFMSVLSSSYADTTHKTTYIAAAMTVGVTYYVRVRYKGSTTGNSDWSAPVQFSVKAITVPDQEEAKLVPADAIANDYVGSRVAISGDGKTIALGVWQRSNSKGYVYIYTKIGTSWVLQSKLSASDGVINDYFSISLALSMTGDVLIVGASGNGTGVVYEFGRSAGVWTQRFKITPNDASTAISFGYSVALSKDMSTLLVGATTAVGQAAGTGAAYAFTKVSGVWTQEAKLFSTTITGAAIQGCSVALSSDGNTALIGAERYAGTGSAVVFTRNNKIWAQQKIFDAPAMYTGCSVALSGDGNVAVVGGYNAPSPGMVLIYTRVGTTWSTGQVLKANINGDRFGISVDISENGAIICVGSDAVNTYKGGVYLYKQSASQNGWTLLSTSVQTPAAAADYLGFNIAASADGDVMVAGAFGHNNNVGAAYVFS